MLQSRPMRIWTPGILVIATLLLLGATEARAQRVAPLIPKFTGEAFEALVIRFHEALGEGLKTGGLQVMKPEVVRKRLNLGVVNAGCFQGPCVSAARAMLKTDEVATAQVEMAGQSYTINVSIYKGNRRMGSGRGHCDICTLTEAVSTMIKVATELGTRTEEPPPDSPGIKPAPRPLKAPGAAPVPAPAPAVRPKLGPSPVVQQTKMTPSSPGSAQQAGERPAVTPRKPWPLWPSLVAAGVGLVGLGVGIPLIALDGEPALCRNDKPNADLSNCSELYATGTGGWVLTGAGLAALATSGVLFYLYYASRPQEQRAAAVDNLILSPTVDGGFVLGATGRF